MKKVMFALLGLLFFTGCVEVGDSTSGVDTDVCSGEDCGEGNTTTTETS